MKNYNHIQKKILGVSLIIIVLFFVMPTMSFGAIMCYDINGLPSYTQGTTCSGTYRYTTRPTPAPSPAPTPTPILAPTPPNTYTSPDGSFQSSWDPATDVTAPKPPASATLGGSTQPNAPGSAGSTFAPSNKASGLIPSDKEIADTGFMAVAKFLNNIITRFIQLSATVAAITFSYAGAQMLLHPDEEAKRSEAKEMLEKTVIGMFIILGAWLVLNTVVNTLVNPSINALRFLK